MSDTTETSLRQRKKQQVRDDILDAARTLIAHQGFDAMSMRALADRANVSHQTLYNYFATKATLAAAILDQDSVTLTARMNALFEQPQTDLLTRFRQAIELLFEMIDEDTRSLWREVAFIALRTPADFMPTYGAYYDHAQQRMRSAILDAAERGRLVATADAELLAQTIFSIADHAKLEFIMRPELERAEFTRHVIRQLELVVRPYLR